MILLPTTTTEQFRPLSNAERIEVWRKNSTARNPQASDTAAKRQDGTLSDPLFPKPERGARIADAALIPNEV